MLTRFVGPFVLTVLTIASGRAYGQEGRTFSMPQSVLLFDSPDYELRVITGNSIQVFRPPAKQGPFYLPALSSDGARLAWGVPIGVTPKGERGHFVLGVSPTAQQQWKTYGDFEEVGSAAFSPDGSRVAFTAVETGGGRVFLILNLASGELEALRAQMFETSNRRGSIIGMNRREHQMTGDRGLQSHFQRLLVADLANHNDIRVLA